MVKHRNIDRICIFVCVFALLLAFLSMNAELLGIEAAAKSMPYEKKIFDDTKVHTMDIIIDESSWDSMLENALQEEYVTCAVVIDGETYRNIALRTKGNTSLSQVSSMDSDRYSFKIEFDHYESNKTYYGLDKLILNNIIQDTTYLKDYLTYHMMNDIGVAAPLSSFVNLSVNGEEIGFYLAVEGVEEAMIERSYDTVTGRLYKPDNMSMGGGDQQSRSRDDSASLIYTDDEIESYNTIWNGAVFDITESDQTRLMESLKKLNAGEDLESVVDVEMVLKYFVVHNFVVNFDSYTGNMKHNYYLYENDGQLSMIPWDYNLAFGTFAGGPGGGRGGSQEETAGEETDNATTMVNYPIDTPVYGTTLEDRPMLGKLLENPEYLELYHQYFDEFITDYFESGRFEEMLDEVTTLIAPYVEKDPTAFYEYEEFQKGVETLKTFCTLRAESVRGQLDGSIPSTTEGQSADQSNLVDASSITLSDMGSMAGGRGNEGGTTSQKGVDSLLKTTGANTTEEEMQRLQNEFEAFNSGEGEASGEGTEEPSVDMGEFGDGNMENRVPPTGGEFPTGGGMPPGFESGNTTQEDTDANMRILWLSAASLVVLSAGLIFVWKWERR